MRPPKNNDVESTRSTIHDTPTAYFHTNLGRFIFFVSFSGGLYEYYWFYKNWMITEQASKGKRIRAILRSCISPFLCWRLFKRIHSDAARYGYQHSKLFRRATLLYLLAFTLPPMSMAITLLTTSFMTTESINALFILFIPKIVSLFALIVRIQALLIAQRAIKFYNQHAIPGYIIKRKNTTFEWFCVVWILIFYISYVMPLFAP